VSDLYVFDDIVEDESTLRDIIGTPHPVIEKKVLQFLDSNCRLFIERSPFALIASSDGRASVDISPKGDAPGFVKILDDATLIVPERLGNRRADTFRNVLKHPHVGLIFLIPGKNETLRVSGRAKIVRDKGLMKTMAVKERAPKLGLAVEVEKVLFHCGKSMLRSKLWRPEDWPPTKDLPSLAKILADLKNIKVPKTILNIAIKRDEKKGLY